MTQHTAIAPGWVCVGDITVIAPAWVEALGDLYDITRSRTADAGTYTYRYADLADATSQARATLARHGLAVFQVPTIEGDEVAVRTTVMHTSGVYLVFDPLRLPAGRTAQQAGSGATYARRYSLMAQLGLATEDNDGATAGERPTAVPRALLHPRTVDEFRAAAVERNLTGEEIGAIVRQATGGRTADPEDVWADEREALRLAFDTWTPAGRESTTGVSQPEEVPDASE